MTNDDEEEWGVTIPPKIDDVIYEQALTESYSSEESEILVGSQFLPSYEAP